MKNVLLLFVLFFAQRMIAQTDYDKVPLSTQDECKNAEPTVKKAAELVLSKPMDDAIAMNATRFILLWMDHTEYTFTLDAKELELSKKSNKNLFGVYLACLAKAVLDDPTIAKDNDKIQLQAYGLLADYCADASHGVKITKEVQKLIDAKKDGTIATYIKS